VSSWISSKFGPAFQRYGFALSSVAAAFGATLLLQYITQFRILIPFFGAVIAAGWYGGRGPAWVAVVLSLLIVDYFFGTPLHSWAVSSLDQAFFIPFAVAIVVAGWCGSLRRRVEGWAAHDRKASTPDG
jgi:K+-sensing histidine kinase KdpD